METLYRKYRPIDFDTVVGQETIVRTLQNQIAKGSIAHAYLFSGTRGTGKTTVARIFARAVNCPNEINGNPCNECQACKSAIEGTNLNVLEMDAASSGHVEDVRRINELIAYPPINDEKYKIFIIDEAHALSKDATQAFLKILEEPPEYVVYILATTDPNKLPETILSRCQKYSFKRINIESIVTYLRKICDNEKIETDDDSLIFIAEKSDGSMRESISKLDRCRSYAVNDKLDKKLVETVLGIVDDDDYKNLITAINNSDVKSAFTIISNCVDKGKDIIQFVNDFIWHLRNLLICKDIDEPIETLNITKSNFNKLKEESSLISKDTLIYFIEELSKASNVMKYDENRRVILETCIIRLASPETNFLESAVMARLKKVEENQKNGSYVRLRNDVEVKEDIQENKKKEVKKPEEIKLSPATFEEINKVIENWKTIVSSLDRLSKTILEKAKVIPGNEKEPGSVLVQIKDSYEYEVLKDKDKYKKVEIDLNEISRKLIEKEIIYKIMDISDSKYSETAEIKLDDALSKIDTEKIKVIEDD